MLCRWCLLRVQIFPRNTTRQQGIMHWERTHIPVLRKDLTKVTGSLLFAGCDWQPFPVSRSGQTVGFTLFFTRPLKSVRKLTWGRYFEAEGQNHHCWVIFVGTLAIVFSECVVWVKLGFPSVTFMSLFSPVKIIVCEFLLYFVLF